MLDGHKLATVGVQAPVDHSKEGLAQSLSQELVGEEGEGRKKINEESHFQRKRKWEKVRGIRIALQ